MRSFSKDYRANPKALNQFFSHAFNSAEDTREIMFRRSQKGFSAFVRSNLEQQNKQRSSAVERTLKKLSQPGVTAAVSGQQAALLGGPLMVLYKCLATARWATYLEQLNDTPVVPIYWLQTEDHSVREINHINYLSAEGTRKRFEVNLGDDESMISTAFRQFQTPFANTIAELKSSLSWLPQTQQIFSLLDDGLAQSTNAVDSFRAVLNICTDQLGILFFDPTKLDSINGPSSDTRVHPDDPRPNIFTRTINNFREIESALLTRSDDLALAGYATQVPIKADSPLCFFHPLGKTESRSRLLVKDGSCLLERTPGNRGSNQQTADISLPEMLSLAKSRPELFSPSALLRPLLQDSLFPTAVYIGGPAEVSYLAQSATLYPLFDIEMPLVAPRPHFTVIDAKTKRLLADTELDASEVLENPAVLNEADSAIDKQASQQQEQSSDKFVAIFKELKQDFGEISPALGQSVDTFSNRFFQQFAGLYQKYANALKEKQSVRRSRLSKLADILMPDNAPQERNLSLLFALCKYGPGFPQMVYQRIDPIKPDNQLLQIEDTGPGNLP
ncbi:MAG: bacillithiol biosynthesis cysteine-adding enzyme BshC [bacterium]|nr:bacillithiol biosynthesis cysteine-adding enzyme BshC [bacterium]